MFKQAEFIASASKKGDFPRLLSCSGEEMPEIACVGRSNVGKSSLINHLTQNQHLAHISSKPGKTRLINFFTVDQKVGLIDLPGYGFAKVPKEIRSEWSGLIEDYLTSRKNLKLILHLIDARHPPTKEDLEFAKWALYFQKPMLTVFTKTDKLSKNEVENLCRNHYKCFNQTGDYFLYSIKDGKKRMFLIKEIEKMILRPYA